MSARQSLIVRACVTSALLVLGAVATPSSAVSIGQNPYTCSNAIEMYQPADFFEGHLQGPYVTHYYKIWLWAGDLIVVDGTLDNGDGHFGWTCAGNDIYFLNSNGPLVYTAPNDGYYYMGIHSHERGGDYNVAVTVIPYYVNSL